MSDPSHTLARVLLEWSDGETQELTGDDAQAWLVKCNNALSLNQIRGGYVLPADPWVHHAAPTPAPKPVCGTCGGSKTLPCPRCPDGPLFLKCERRHPDPCPPCPDCGTKNNEVTP